MSAPVASRPRPMTVFTAAFLLSGAAALWVAAAIATFFALPQFSRYYSDLRGDADAGPLIVLLLVAVSTVALLAAGVYVLLAILTANGLFTARVFTWILVALSICVAVGILILDPYQAVPWHQRLNAIVAIVTMAFAVAAVVLLVLPASRAYFRTVQENRRLRQAQALAARRPLYPQPMPYPQAAYPPQSHPNPLAPNPQPPTASLPPPPQGDVRG